MSKWSNLLLDVNYMKQYATDTAKKVSIDMHRYGITTIQRIKDAVTARYWLDKLLLDENDLIDKWYQYIVYDVYDKVTLYRGSKYICQQWIDLNDCSDSCIIEKISPLDMDWDWSKYLEEVCISN